MPIQSIDLISTTHKNLITARKYMNFLPTFYIHPLKEKILLSKHLNIYFDNPRTNKEIEALTEYIKNSYELHTGAFTPPLYSDDNKFSLEKLIQGFIEKSSELDEYAENFCKLYTRENIFEFIARMWIIARYDDFGQFESLDKEYETLKANGNLGVLMLEDDHPILINLQKLSNFSHLLSSLINTRDDGYLGHSFLISNDNQIFNPLKICKQIPINIYIWSSNCRLHQNNNDPMRWHFYPNIKNALTEASALLENNLEKNESKLLYIGDTLRVSANNSTDEKIQLIMLVSIIELLLTHNPDFNRFNIEDSISKQFILKSSILIYLQNKSKDINSIKSRLKIIYSIRSAIAHGNFKEVDKFIKNLSKKEGKEEYFEDLITDLHKYIKCILNQFLSDSSFVEFLKEN